MTKSLNFSDTFRKILINMSGANTFGGLYVKDKQEEQRSKITKAAMKVLFEQGLNEMTFRNVAAEAGISPGTLYYYYNTKDLMLYDILDHNTSKTVALVETLHNDLSDKNEVFPVLMEMMNDYVKNTKQNMIFLHILHEAVSGNVELADKINEKYQAWFESFEDMIEIYYGISKGPLNKAMAIFIDALIDGFSLMELLGIKTLDQPEMKRVISYILSEEFGKNLQAFSS